MSASAFFSMAVKCVV